MQVAYVTRIMLNVSSNEIDSYSLKKKSIPNHLFITTQAFAYQLIQLTLGWVGMQKAQFLFPAVCWININLTLPISLLCWATVIWKCLNSHKMLQFSIKNPLNKHQIGKCLIGALRIERLIGILKKNIDINHLNFRLQTRLRTSHVC